MADHLRDQFGVEATLIRGGGGVFDVTVDGELIFSKHSQGRFPDNEEVSAAIRQRE